jgi:beta-glucosidase-like glycosyl hydrolase
MKALQGTTTELAIQALEAGVDVALACSGRIEEARSLLGTVPKLSDNGWRRLRAARRRVARL